MKQIILTFSILVAMVSCTTERYMPKTVDSAIYFGMPESKFKALKGDKAKRVEDEMTFRHTYLEEVNSNGIQHIGYYFDADNDKPLYEIILIYESEALRDKAARKLLGQPNAEEGKEWRITPKEGYPIMAWTFKTKLVVVSQIPQTEWHPDENKSE